MATPSQLGVKFDALLKAINTKIAGKLGSTARAADSSKLEGKTLAQVKADVVSDTLGGVNGRRGEMAFFKEEGTPMSFMAGEMLTKFRLASDDATIDTLKNETVSFADVYNNWQRISHSNNLQFPANITEMNSWSYNAQTDSVLSTVNSGTLIGMIGLDRFDAYTFETVMSSSANDDDTIGMCAAFKRSGGREYTLTVMVSGGGMLPSGGYSGEDTPWIWCGVNYNQGAANGAVTLFQQQLGIPRQFWNTEGALKAGIRVKLVRSAVGTLQITATQPDGSPWPNPVFATVNIPAIFLDPCQIGYVAVSQPSSTWQNLQVPVAKRDIIDTRDKSVWRWNNTSGSWVNAGKYTDPSVLIPGRLYKNMLTPYGAYYLDFEGTLITLGVPNQL